METEPTTQNPYELMSDEALDYVTLEIQRSQRELTREVSLIDQARLKKYVARLGRE